MKISVLLGGVDASGRRRFIRLYFLPRPTRSNRPPLKFYRYLSRRFSGFFFVRVRDSVIYSSRTLPTSEIVDLIYNHVF